ncbi:MAG: hypothetical protein IH588_04685 [Anaerolineales bacterium]|nr:hypothetical protein [Anaerolineales bacterium]
MMEETNIPPEQPKNKKNDALYCDRHRSFMLCMLRAGAYFPTPSPKFRLHTVNIFAPVL